MTEHKGKSGAVARQVGRIATSLTSNGVKKGEVMSEPTTDPYLAAWKPLPHEALFDCPECDHEVDQTGHFHAPTCDFGRRMELNWQEARANADQELPEAVAKAAANLAASE
jgi:hypothetical protein